MIIDHNPESSLFFTWTLEKVLYRSFWSKETWILFKILSLVFVHKDSICDKKTFIINRKTSWNEHKAIIEPQLLTQPFFLVRTRKKKKLLLICIWINDISWLKKDQITREKNKTWEKRTKGLILKGYCIVI